MTGHPDHTIVSVWTTLALALANTQALLLWATKAPDWAAAFPAINSEVFPDTSPPTAPADRLLSLSLDDATLARKVRALEAHAGQTSGIITTFGRKRYAEWVRDEAFEIDDRSPPPAAVRA